MHIAKELSLKLLLLWQLAALIFRLAHDENGVAAWPLCVMRKERNTQSGLGRTANQL